MSIELFGYPLLLKKLNFGIINYKFKKSIYYLKNLEIYKSKLCYLKKLKELICYKHKI
jgi:hypothetical protein